MSTASHGYAGPYRLLNIINTGQTSQVWQAYHDGSRKYVAVKMLQREYARDKEHVRFLKWEYTVAGKIEHERICRVYQFGRERGIPYLALEWFPAPNLNYHGEDGRGHLTIAFAPIPEPSGLALGGLAVRPRAPASPL